MISGEDYQVVIENMDDIFRIKDSILDSVFNVAANINLISREFKDQDFQKELIDISVSAYNLIAGNLDQEISSADIIFLRKIQSHVTRRFGNINDFYEENGIILGDRVASASDGIGFEVSEEHII